MKCCTMLHITEILSNKDPSTFMFMVLRVQVSLVVTHAVRKNTDQCYFEVGLFLYYIIYLRCAHIKQHNIMTHFEGMSFNRAGSSSLPK